MFNVQWNNDNANPRSLNGEAKRANWQ